MKYPIYEFFFFIFFWLHYFPQMSTSELLYDDKRLSNISENSEDSCQSHGSERLTYSQTAPSHATRYPHYTANTLPKVRPQFTASFYFLPHFIFIASFYLFILFLFYFASFSFILEIF